MKHFKPSYFVGQAFQGVWRNGVMSFASIAVLMSCLVVLGSFTLLVANINTNLENLGLMNEIMVFVEYDLPEDDIVEVERQIKQIDHIGKVERISADEALESMIERAGDRGYLYEQYRNDNPLSDKFRITEVDSGKISSIEYSLGQIEGIRKVRDQLSLAQTMQALKNGVMLIFSWFLVVLFIVSIFVIINTVKLSVYSRKDEISIMRYVGATGLFISLPFVIEGALIGLISSVIAYFVENFLYKYIETSMVDLQGIVTIIPLSEVTGIVFAGFIAVGVLTGVIGSTISLSKYTNN